MKKLLIAIFSLYVVNNIYSQVQFGFIPVNIGMSVFENNNYFDVDINFSYISYEIKTKSDKDINMGIGFVWIPVNYKYIKKNHYWSLVNFQLYWDIFALIPIMNQKNKSNDWFIRSLYPFISINYAPNFNIKDYIFSYGIRYDISAKANNLSIYLFNIECGQRNINNIKRIFYMNIGIDIMTLLLMQ